jgi:signal peptidase I
LINQENPYAKVTVKVQLYINGEYSNNLKVLNNGFQDLSFDEINFNAFDIWVYIENIVASVKQQFHDKNVEVKKLIFLNDKLVHTYLVKNDNYFMMGDNRDNSMDSRYWGFLNKNFIKAKAFILYFSWDDKLPLWEFPMKIRWNRIGKLIRSWDGQPKK